VFLAVPDLHETLFKEVADYWLMRILDHVAGVDVSVRHDEGKGTGVLAPKMDGVIGPVDALCEIGR